MGQSGTQVSMSFVFLIIDLLAEEYAEKSLRERNETAKAVRKLRLFLYFSTCWLQRAQRKYVEKDMNRAKCGTQASRCIILFLCWTCMPRNTQRKHFEKDMRRPKRYACLKMSDLLFLFCNSFITYNSHHKS